jgi:hypothetical protein
MIWVHLYGKDGKLLLVCPATEAQMWNLLDGDRWFQYALVPDEEAPCP